MLQTGKRARSCLTSNAAFSTALLVFSAASTASAAVGASATSCWAAGLSGGEGDHRGGGEGERAGDGDQRGGGEEERAGEGDHRGGGERERELRRPRWPRAEEEEEEEDRRGDGERERERDRRRAEGAAAEAMAWRVSMKVSVARCACSGAIASSKTSEIKAKVALSSLVTLGPSGSRHANANSAASRNLSAGRRLPRALSMLRYAVWITSALNRAKEVPSRPLIGVVMFAASVIGGGIGL
jgi:hypothetical protein